MTLDNSDQQPGARLLFVLACLVVIVAGLRVAAPILVPFVLALFIAVVSMPLMFGMRRRGMPAPLAILFTVLIDALIFGLMGVLVVSSLGDLNERLPFYADAVETIYQGWLSQLQERGIPAGAYLTFDLFDPARIFTFLGTLLQAVAEVLSIGFIVGIIIIFILAEATIFPFKFQAILGGGRRQGRIRVTNTVDEVQAYLWIKFQISLVRGICVGVMCWLTNLDFPLMLGLVAFILSFVPTIGSIIAAVPGIVLALVLHGEISAIIVALGYLAIDMGFGNLLEPNVMGRRVGLSTLVVVLSLLFWGWVWGPIGALLSVPLTMVLKIGVENVPDLQWIAILLDNKVPAQVSEAADRAAVVPPDVDPQAEHAAV